MKLTATEAQRLAQWYIAVAMDYEQAAQRRGKYGWQLMRAASGARQTAARYAKRYERLVRYAKTTTAVRTHAHG